MSDLDIAFNAIKAKQDAQNKLFNYYNGDQPAVYSAKRLKEAFKNIDVTFSENWCSVVVDALLDRLNLERIDGKGKSEDINDMWFDRDMDDEADEAHKSAAIAGETYVIVWPDQDGKAEAFYNDPRKCHAQPDPENPKRIGWAAKMWKLDTGEWRLNLYYPDRIEKYTTKPMDKDTSPSEAMAFELNETIPNPYKALPVFCLQCKSELTDILSPQIAVNKLMNDMMIASEYGALKQRYVISEADTKALKNAPNEIWSLPEGSEAGEFGETDLKNFIQAMDREVSVISTISKTPKHYFMNQGGDPSGEALIAMEAGLNKKANHYIRRFKKFWRDVVEFMLIIEGAQVEKADITPVYESPETVQPKTRAEIIQAEVNAGIPLVTSLRRKGWTNAEIEEMQKDKLAEQTAQAELAQAYMERARANANQETE